jgi:putative molybdopterin biosynthesis protein
VAAFVATGMADVGLGIEPAGRLEKLDFIPIAMERYMLTRETATLAQRSVAELIALLKGSESAQMMASVEGYALDSPGEAIAFQKLFPWIAVPKK